MCVVVVLASFPNVTPVIRIYPGWHSLAGAAVPCIGPCLPCPRVLTALPVPCGFKTSPREVCDGARSCPARAQDGTEGTNPSPCVPARIQRDLDPTSASTYVLNSPPPQQTALPPGPQCSNRIWALSRSETALPASKIPEDFSLQATNQLQEFKLVRFVQNKAQLKKIRMCSRSKQEACGGNEFLKV